MGNVYNLDSFELCGRALFDPGRFDRPDLDLGIAPSFQISLGDRVFVMGSCFAEEIRMALESRGFTVTDAGLGNKYNTFSMLQTVTWALDGGFGERFVSQVKQGRWFDGHRYPLEYHKTAQEAVDVHQETLDRTREVLESCDVIIMTLGLVEVWRDNQAEAWLNNTPPRKLLGRYPGRFSVVRTTHAQNLEAFLALLRKLRSANASARIVCSVSPVPLMATFFGNDVVVSNMYSKCTLRSVVTEAIQAEADRGSAPVDYFPSYEMVMLRPRDEVWRDLNPVGQPDGRHVRPEFVREVIIRTFMEHYLPELVPAS